VEGSDRVVKGIRIRLGIFFRGWIKIGDVLLETSLGEFLEALVEKFPDIYRYTFPKSWQE
jgi:hypothetical protein